MIARCKNVIDSNTVFDSSEIMKSSTVTNSHFCQECSDIDHCMFCDGISGVEYHIFKKPIDSFGVFKFLIYAVSLIGKFE